VSEAETDQWEVRVKNGPINLFDWVRNVFMEILGCDAESALAMAKQIHTEGETVVWTGARAECEERAYSLQDHGLHAVIVRVVT